MAEEIPMHQMTPTKNLYNIEGELPFNMKPHMLDNPFTSPTMDTPISMSPTAPRADEKYTEGTSELPQARKLFGDITNNPVVNPLSESRSAIIKRDAELEEAKKADIKRDKLSKKIRRKHKLTFLRGLRGGALRQEAVVEEDEEYEEYIYFGKDGPELNVASYELFDNASENVINYFKVSSGQYKLFKKYEDGEREGNFYIELDKEYIYNLFYQMFFVGSQIAREEADRERRGEVVDGESERYRVFIQTVIELYLDIIAHNNAEWANCAVSIYELVRTHYRHTPRIYEPASVNNIVECSGQLQGGKRNKRKTKRTRKMKKSRKTKKSRKSRKINKRKNKQTKKNRH